ncbi:MAG: hypothetical protein HYV27_09950 [Candidatus Hydrogenedentes bacterium]|nr:hypothetical protein [Candidatus Hydrogenedentota bacterium]
MLQYLYKRGNVLGLICGMVVLCGALAARADVPPVHVDPTAPPARAISEYHLFKDAARQIPNDGVVPYELNTPLFSDYAEKHRFIWMPEGASATYTPEGPFDFPVGTAIVKTFGFLHDLRDPAKGERIVETRLLIRKESGWLGLPYLWNEEVTEAKLAVVGARADVTWTHSNGEQRSIDYIIPNMNQCKQCHENSGAMQPIGPKAGHLNRDFSYASGVENQLTHLSRIGYLRGAPGDPARTPYIPVFDDPATGNLDRRARAWLDVNCAHCHNPKGPAFTSGLDLSFHQEEAMRYGVMKPPVAAGRAGTRMYSIVPGKPDESILMFRIESVDPGIMMPQLPRRVVHDEGVALIREWIESMPERETPAK